MLKWLFCIHAALLYSCSFFVLKDTHREKAPSNETPILSKSMSMDIWVIGTSNRLFIRDTRFLHWNKIFEKIVTGKTQFFVIDPFCTPHSIWRNINFWQSSSYGNVAFLILALSATKRYSSRLKKVWFFRENGSKLKYWKRSKFLVIAK